jgi:undecaprenyl-diphosphatase
MSLTDILILALIQGLTEFLPVSSSGHLVFAKKLLGFIEYGLEMELWLHLATLASLGAYFWRDLKELTLGLFGRGGKPEEKGWPLFIFVSTAITGVVGVVGRKAFVDTFDDARLLAWGFLASGVLILATRAARERRTGVTLTDAVWFGLAQAVSILPSVSRSGATIACLLFLGVDRSTAFRYSFIASIPAIFAAFLLEITVGSFALFTPAALAASFALAFASGLATLWLLRRFVVNYLFWTFGFYCLAAGILSFYLVH